MPFQGASNHLYTYRQATQRLLEKFSVEELQDGDIYIGNDPYEIGTAHSPDTVIITPVLYQGTLVAFCCSIAHKMDFGGAVPGSVHMGATEIFQEGLIVPLMKMYEQGKVVSQVEDIIRTNVRNSDLVLGDLGAQVGATLVGARHVKALAARYGVQTLLDCFKELTDLPRKRISSIVAEWPGFEAEAEALLDPPPNHDTPVRLHLRMTRNGGELTFDFSGTDPQVRSPINTVGNAVSYLCSICLLGVTDPDLIENTGVARSFNLVTKEGTVAHPSSPAPVGSTTRVMGAYIDVIMDALAQLKGEEGIAARGDCGTVAFGWRDGLVAGRRYVQYEIQNGAGTGGTAWRDGVSGVNPHSYVYSRRTMDTSAVLETPIEILEAQYPVRVRRFELIPDSGGVAKFRGGVGRRRVYEALAPADFNVRRAHGFVIPSPGVNGGLAGRRGRVIHNSQKSSGKELKDWSLDLESGDTVGFEGPGGGGYGDPFERDPEYVLRDVIEGFVSPEGAHQGYGVAIAQNGTYTLDLEATKRLRSQGNRDSK